MIFLGHNEIDLGSNAVEETRAEDILTRKVDHGGDITAFVCWKLLIGLNCLNFDTSYFGTKTDLKSQVVCGYLIEVVKAFHKVNGKGNKGHTYFG